MSGGQVGGPLMDRGAERHDLLRLIFRVLGDGDGSCAGGDDGGGNDGEARDFHSSDVSVILRDFCWGQVPSRFSLKDYLRASLTAVLRVF
jgi:hypothetical protein